MKAWHVQDRDYENQEIVFAETKGKAKQQSEAASWGSFINVIAKRAKYADDLENDKEALIKAQLENDWYFECGKCFRTICIEDDAKIYKGHTYCPKCLELII